MRGLWTNPMPSMWYQPPLPFGLQQMLNINGTVHVTTDKTNLPLATPTGASCLHGPTLRSIKDVARSLV